MTGMSQRSIVITGAAGFVCANLVLHFASQGYRVIACDIDTPSEPLKAAWSRTAGDVKSVILDVDREEEWARALDAEHIDTLIHGAAVTPPEPDPLPGRTLRVNLLGTLAGLEYARRRRCLRFFLISSAAVYRGLRSRKPLSEDLVVPGVGSYAASKLGAERLVSLYRESYELDACSVRLTGPYGPWERPTATRDRMSVIFQLATAALRGEVIRIVGRHVKRDWTYVGDVAVGIAHLASLRTLPFDLFNLTAGAAVPLGEIVKIFATMYPIRLGRSRHDLREITIQSALLYPPLDAARIRATGFEATTDLREGLRLYLDWLRGDGAFVWRSERT